MNDELKEEVYKMVHGEDGLNDNFRYSEYQTYAAVPMASAPYRPKAGHIVNAFANYRLSHPLVRWYYKIKELLQWRINIKFYKGD